MKCSVCNIELTMSERQGIEIDYCPTCRGVWLDRGELDKIVERSASHHGRGIEAYLEQNRGYYDKDRYEHHHAHKKHKAKSFLEELFD